MAHENWNHFRDSGCRGRQTVCPKMSRIAEDYRRSSGPPDEHREINTRWHSGLDTRLSLNNPNKLLRRSLMNLKTIAIASAVGSLLALGSVTVSAEDAAKEKCLGVAEAGKNDCATGDHSCAGQAKADKDADEWKYVPKGECEKMGGKVAPKRRRCNDPCHASIPEVCLGADSGTRRNRPQVRPSRRARSRSSRRRLDRSAHRELFPRGRRRGARARARPR